MSSKQSLTRQPVVSTDCVHGLAYVCCFRVQIGTADGCHALGIIASHGSSTQRSMQGEDIKYTITAGYCVYSSSGGPVTCTQPSVTVAKLPAFCNLAFTSAASVTVRMLATGAPSELPHILLFLAGLSACDCQCCSMALPSGIKAVLKDGMLCRRM